MASLRRLPGFAIAIVALALSASLTFAGEPAGAGLAKAASQAGKSVPVRAGGPDQADKEQDKDKDAEAEDDGGENCATDPRTLTDEQRADMSHGSVVCWAAHQETPDGYRNHGAWVSSWARGENGQQAPAKTKGVNR